MAIISARFTTVPGTEAAEGRAGDHSIVADRPAGVAGGQGLGFNGGQLLALAVGGCICNDLRYVAHRRGIEVGAFDVAVDVEVADGDVTRVSAQVEPREGQRHQFAELFDEALASSTIVRAVTNGAPVDVSLS